MPSLTRPNETTLILAPELPVDGTQSRERGRSIGGPRVAQNAEPRASNLRGEHDPVLAMIGFGSGSGTLPSLGAHVH
jgi:hypothetical protein